MSTVGPRREPTARLPEPHSADAAAGPRATRTAVLALAALICLAAGARAALAETEVVWQSVGAGAGELSPGQGFDLDFGDMRQSPPDFQFDRGDVGYYWTPYHVRPGIGCAVALAPGEFASLDLAKTESLTLSLDRIYLCGGSAPPLPNGTTLVVKTCEGNTSKVVIDDCGATLKFRFETFRKQTVVKAPVSGVLPAPEIRCPADGIAFDHNPRVLMLAWGAVQGAATYDLELDCKGCCGPRHEMFCAEQENGAVQLSKTGLTTTEYDEIWRGPYPGRWRVRALKADGTPGLWTGWTRFSFNK
jgi:hypothetical protein